ncbi:hypothetical protein K474DRAFT_1703383 [Panus rudis PR-1116 ss-1]|nr:hypothetical protein K474DRAFT_1703383 [Panus rudis PR-1116 ss-1]
MVVGTLGFIVGFKDSATPEEIQRYKSDISKNGGSIEVDNFGDILKAFTAAIPAEYLQNLQAQSLQGDSPIAYIEPDGIVTTQN